MASFFTKREIPYLQKLTITLSAKLSNVTHSRFITKIFQCLLNKAELNILNLWRIKIEQVNSLDKKKRSHQLPRNQNFHAVCPFCMNFRKFLKKCPYFDEILRNNWLNMKCVCHKSVVLFLYKYDTIQHRTHKH